jgi:hypothetical protein
MKILAFSGLRLGAAFPEWPRCGAEIRHALRQTLERLVARAAAEGYHAVISAGDLFDSNSVPVEELRAVIEICTKHPGLPLVLLPGGRDPWGPYSVYRHLQLQAPANLKLLRPGRNTGEVVQPDLFCYGLGVDAGNPLEPSLSVLERDGAEGVHAVVAYGDLGRLKPGPEEGLVMVSPEITGHPFDLLILADGGAAEKLGNARKPACYAAPLGPFGLGQMGAGQMWDIVVGEGETRMELVRAGDMHEEEITIDATGFADAASLAQAIRRKAGKASLARIILTGSRPADHLFLEPELQSRCASDVFALSIVDRMEIRAPENDANRDPAAARLWECYRAAEGDDRREWLDALKLHAAGVHNPDRWREAPWASL